MWPFLTYHANNELYLVGITTGEVYIQNVSTTNGLDSANEFNQLRLQKVSVV